MFCHFGTWSATSLALSEMILVWDELDFGHMTCEKYTSPESKLGSCFSHVTGPVRNEIPSL